jgi:hypothetical protein
VECDALAARYGKWPHEVMELDAGELAIAVLCASAGRALTQRMAQDIAGQKGLVVFAIDLASR